MTTYYQALRLHPDKDIQGKNEDDINKKVEANYKVLVARAPQMYPQAPVREQILKLIEEARTVLLDPQRRAAYDKQLQDEIETREREMREMREMVSIEVIE